MSIETDPDLVRWPFWEPVLVGSTLVLFRCHCEWETQAVRPEVKGTFVGICDQAQSHLVSEHHGRWSPPPPHPRTLARRRSRSS